MMVLTLVTVVVKAAACEIAPVFAIETGMIMLIIKVVMVVAMPCRIRIIGVAGIFPFGNSDMHLGARGIEGEGAGHDHRQDQ